MKACPLRFDHPSEAQQLHGLGPKLCDRLADKLRIHCADNGLPMPQLPHRRDKRKSDDEDEVPAPPAKKMRKTKQYVPALRSGAYALVLALATADENSTQGMTKAETIELAQPHSDSSFTAPSDPTKFYTAWNSMKALVGKDLVYERGRPTKRYMLTDEGWEVARRIQGIATGSIASMITEAGKTAGQRIPEQPKTKNNGVFQGTSNQQADSEQLQLPDLEESEEQENGMTSPEKPRARAEDRASDTLPSYTPITLPAGSFDVQLVLDTREVRTMTDRDYISSELLKSGVRPVTRALPLGDALWIACVKQSHEHILNAANADDEEDGRYEIVLDHILERKRLDDLIGSIKDGRFHEQKFRLRRSGLKNITYLIEEFSISAEHGEKYGEAVASAIASTQVVNGFFVKQTQKLDDTIRYLARMTRTLQKQYEKEDLCVIPTKVLHSNAYLRLMTHLRDTQPAKSHYTTFSAFSALSSKAEMMSSRDVFLKMLMCTRGVTGEKVLCCRNPRPCCGGWHSCRSGSFVEQCR